MGASSALDRRKSIGGCRHASARLWAECAGRKARMVTKLSSENIGIHPALRASVLGLRLERGYASFVAANKHPPECFGTRYIPPQNTVGGCWRFPPSTSADSFDAPLPKRYFHAITAYLMAGNGILLRCRRKHDSPPRCERITTTFPPKKCRRMLEVPPSTSADLFVDQRLTIPRGV